MKFIRILFLLVTVNSEKAFAVRMKRNTETCGVAKVSSGFIVRGENFARGNFPWIVALTYIKEQPPIFFCGGTIISSNFVISGEFKK